ncbi:MAG TPA: histidine kinase dimerization/phospho-acceptor domain-containing protein, partial [Polyangia bacterium]|nr:histidine kinase dimerization/phospho-acceptor domain-containing protein [Polyangia bacterium]
MAVLLPAAFMLDSWIGDGVRDLVRESLTREAEAMAGELQRAKPADLADWVAHSATTARVTVIDGDGRVRGDSDVALNALPNIENHATRPEVRDALIGNIGVDARRSQTLGRTLIYVAVPVHGDGTAKVLRLALPLDQVGATVGRAHFAVWLAGLMALVLALLLGTTLSRWLTRPILAMTRAARAMSHGDFEASLPEPGDDELGELVHALDTLRNQLAMRLAELRQEGVKLRAIVNGMSEGVALVQDGIISVANPAFGRLLKVSAEVEGRSVRDATRLPAVGDAIDAALSKGKNASREVQIGGRALLVQVDPLESSPTPQAVVVLIDVTEPKRLERLRREFVANASHELRTPVAAIVGVAETLAAGAADNPEARQSFLEILIRHSQRLSRLTSDLLDIARLEAGYRPRVEVVELNRSIDAVIGSLQVKADDKRIELSKTVPAELRVSAERAAVEQILTNLVENAIKYTPSGGRVHVQAELKGSKIRIIVADTGPGIPSEHHARLFERFYRVD